MTEVLEERLATGDQRLVSENECGESAVKAASGCGEAQTRRLMRAKKRRLTDACKMAGVPNTAHRQMHSIDNLPRDGQLFTATFHPCGRR